MREASPLIQAKGITVRFGTHTVLDSLDLEVFKGEILGLVGGSGSGKSVLMRALIGLLPMQAGDVRFLFGDKVQTHIIASDFGMLFQHGALFSSLTVRENVEVPLKEYTNFDARTCSEIARMKISLVGLPQIACEKYPSELSGGMIKRAALARALALDPHLLFLDEPTAGLDPIGAQGFDKLIQDLQQALNLTVLMVTHDLDSLVSITNRIAVLRLGKILTTGSYQNLTRFQDDWVQEYFNGPRGRAVLPHVGQV